MSCRIKHIHDSLLVDHRSKDDRKIIERSKSLLDGDSVLLHGVAVLLHSVPLVYNHHATLSVSLNKVEDSHILRLYTCLSINHKDADIRMLDGTDRPHHRVELKVLMNLGLLSHTRSVHKHEFVTELVIKSCN